MRNVPYAKGLQQIADGVHAYIQPDGSWGWSNAGLVVGEGSSLLVDTLFDLKLTGEMLEEMDRFTGASPIATVVNTHANGDHCYGNQLVSGPGVEIVASEAAARELDDVPPALMAAAVATSGDDAFGTFMRHAFGPFEFDGIEVPEVTKRFSGELDLTIGGNPIRLIEVGPAHTAGDVIAWLPEQRVVFTGDILFIGGTPVMWAGPTSNWINACDLIEELEPDVVVPGHGPLTDTTGVHEVGDYMRFIQAEVAQRHKAGMDPAEATRDIDLAVNGTRFGSWSERERLVVTVHSAWSEVEPSYVKPDAIGMLTAMAKDFVVRRS